jgi:hypothetical protein
MDRKLKRVIESGHVLVTTTARVHVKNIISEICYNLKQLKTIQKSSS